MTESLESWKAQERAVVLTKGQWSDLTSYIALSKSYREEEVAAWARLAQKKDEEGEARYKNAESNAEFWVKLNASIEVICKLIDGL